jgi:hypothetical protein
MDQESELFSSKQHPSVSKGRPMHPQPKKKNKSIGAVLIQSYIQLIVIRGHIG